MGVDLVAQSGFGIDLLGIVPIEVTHKFGGMK